jgi:hypothetical protein
MPVATRYYYPNAAMSAEELWDWAILSAEFSSRGAEDPRRILLEATRDWGKPVS